MKKSKIIFAVLAMIFVISGCQVQKGEDKKPKIKALEELPKYEEYSVMPEEDRWDMLKFIYAQPDENV